MTGWWRATDSGWMAECVLKRIDWLMGFVWLEISDWVVKIGWMMKFQLGRAHEDWLIDKVHLTRDQWLGVENRPTRDEWLNDEISTWPCSRWLTIDKVYLTRNQWMDGGDRVTINWLEMNEKWWNFNLVVLKMTHYWQSLPYSKWMGGLTDVSNWPRSEKLAGSKQTVLFLRTTSIGVSITFILAKNAPTAPCPTLSW